MSGEILVTFESIAQAQGDVAATSSSINGQLADLKSYLAPMVSSWTGAAAQDYQAKQAQWDSAARDLNTVLAQIGAALGTAHDNYNQAETANRNTWS